MLYIYILHRIFDALAVIFVSKIRLIGMNIIVIYSLGGTLWH